jgi:ribonuclease P protein component
MGRFIFQKAERLSKKKSIQELFDKGSSFYLFPFKVLYLPNPDVAEVKHQILISVSTRNFKHAVDRNLVKRRIREAYRLQKEFIQNTPYRGMFAFIYTAKEILPFANIRDKMFLVLKKIEKLEVH